MKDFMQIAMQAARGAGELQRGAGGGLDHGEVAPAHVPLVVLQLAHEALGGALAIRITRSGTSAQAVLSRTAVLSRA